MPATPDDTDVLDAVARARLTYTTDVRPGFRRVRHGRGFRYEGPRGGAVSDDDKAWIESLVIPPAWTDVWISTDRRGHLLATGRDARGRKQHRYHPRWRKVRDETKFARLPEFGAALPDLRAEVDGWLRKRTLSQEKVVALVVRLLDDTLVRVGNAEYAAENGSFGLTTLRSDHVALSDRRAVFCFVAKGGQEHEVEVADAALARAVRRCHELGGQELFAYEGPDGEPVDVTSSHVNDFLRAATGLDVSAKIFRTWGGTVTAAEHLAKAGPPEDDTDAEARILEAVDHAASVLGNTRAVARASYVHPQVPDAYRSGELAEVWPKVRRSDRLDRAERLVLRLLDPS
jgi:DNA topoisomerase I